MANVIGDRLREAGYPMPKNQQSSPRNQRGGGQRGRRDNRGERRGGGQGERRGDRGAYRGGGQSGYRGGGQNIPSPSFPNSYFVTDEKGNRCLSADFVSKEVDVLARILANKGLSTGQLRRFFNHCLTIKRRLEVDDETWKQVVPDFESLVYYAQYAVSSGRYFPKEFQNFINDNVDRVKRDKNPREAFLRGFIIHFEALVGFGSKHITRR